MRRHVVTTEPLAEEFLAVPAVHRAWRGTDFCDQTARYGLINQSFDGPGNGHGDFYRLCVAEKRQLFGVRGPGERHDRVCQADPATEQTTCFGEVAGGFDCRTFAARNQQEHLV